MLILRQQISLILYLLLENSTTRIAIQCTTDFAIGCTCQQKSISAIYCQKMPKSHCYKTVNFLNNYENNYKLMRLIIDCCSLKT